MDQTLRISLSQPAFSLLLYENVRSNHNQEGLLLGEIIEKELNSITDNDEQVTKIDRIIKIKSAIPCPSIGYFYDWTGNIVEEKIKSLLGNSKNKVVAWYTFKRSNAFKLTVREKMVHKNLIKFFDIPETSFTCCLLTSSFNRVAPTHSYSQIFVRYNRPTFQNLPMRIVNLSDPSHEYKNPEPSSEAFNKLYRSLSIDNDRTQNVNVVSKINVALQKCTDELLGELCEGEKKMYDLVREIESLKMRLKEKKEMRGTVKNNFIPLENGKNATDDGVTGSPPKLQDAVNKKSTVTTPRAKRTLKGTFKDDNDKRVLRSTSKTSPGTSGHNRKRST